MRLIWWEKFIFRLYVLFIGSAGNWKPNTKLQYLLLCCCCNPNKKRWGGLFSFWLWQLYKSKHWNLVFSTWFLVNGWSNGKDISDGNTQMPLSLKHHSTPPLLVLNHHTIFWDNIGREFIQSIGNLLNTTTTTCYVCFKLLRVPRCPICGARTMPCH